MAYFNIFEVGLFQPSYFYLMKQCCISFFAANLKTLFLIFTICKKIFFCLVTVTLRVSLSWVYDVVIPDAIRVKYNLALNKTNDVSNSVFTLLREKAASIQLINRRPPGNVERKLL